MKIRLLLALAVPDRNRARRKAPDRWVDAGGKVHYGDTPPPAAVQKVNKRGKYSAQRDDRIALRGAQAAKNFPVTLYTARGLRRRLPARRVISSTSAAFRSRRVAS